MASSSIEYFSADDPEMEAAIGSAKETFSQFLEAFLEPKESQSSFLLKAAFPTERAVEHLWVANLEFTGTTVRGVIANEPNSSNMKFMQPVQFEPSQITDWMYIDNSCLVGGYTIRVIRDRMTSVERRSFDQSVPYRFS